MTPLEIEILKTLINNDGACSFTKLFTKVKSIGNREALQGLLDRKFVCVFFAEPLKSSEMTAEITFWGYEAYNKVKK